MAGAGCVFCAIAAGDLGAEIVLEETNYIAFLDKRPVFPGHVLLIPRAHHGTLGDLPAALGPRFFELAQILSRAVPEAMGAAGTFVAINNKVSQSVPHLHLHVVPRRPKDGLRGFFWPRNPYRDDREMSAAADAIRAALAASG